MKKANISVTIECMPAAGRLPQAVALVELLLNDQFDGREVPAALVSVLLEISGRLEAGELPNAARSYEAWEQVEAACEVVAEQLQSVLTRNVIRSEPSLAGTNGSNGTHDCIELNFQEAEE